MRLFVAKKMNRVEDIQAQILEIDGVSSKAGSRIGRGFLLQVLFWKEEARTEGGR